MRLAAGLDVGVEAYSQTPSLRYGRLNVAGRLQWSSGSTTHRRFSFSKSSKPESATINDDIPANAPSPDVRPQGSQLRVLLHLIGWQSGGRRRFALLVALTIALAVLEGVGVGAIGPFIAIANAPAEVLKTTAGAWLAALLGTRDPSTLLLRSGLLFALLFLIKAGVALALGWTQVVYSQQLYASLSTRVLRGYLAMPLLFHVTANSAVLIRNVTSETYRIVYDLVFQVIAIAAELSVVALILLALAFANWKLAGIVSVLGAALILGVIWLNTRLGRHYGQARDAYNQDMIRIAQSSLTGIREIQLAGKEAAFADAFWRSARKYGFTLAIVNYLQAFPRLALEGLAVVAVILIFVFAGQGGTDNNGVALAVMYVAAAYRLIPSANRLMVSGLLISYALPSARLAIPSLLQALALDNQIHANEQRLPFERLVLQNVGYTYPGTDAATLNSVSFEIAKGDVIGLMGTSGAGKTTLLTLMGGLLMPTSGELKLNQRSIRDLSDLTTLRSSIAYVPQSVFIADDTLRANIALGEIDEAIDTARLKSAISAAQLTDVVAGLEQGLDTQIGERGARLSGGQAQRVGIARALYLCRPLLILDEATSALDQATEQALMQSLKDAPFVEAVFMVTHREAALSHCTAAYKLDGGALTPVPLSS